MIMVMSKGKKIAIGSAIAVIIGGGAAAKILSAKQPSSTQQPPPSEYTISLSASTTTVTIGQTVVFTATVLENGNPAQGIPVTLTDLTTGKSSTTNTNSSGIAEFDITFGSNYVAGTQYVLQASAIVP
jgi:hypothetical protein